MTCKGRILVWYVLWSKVNDCMVWYMIQKLGKCQPCVWRGLVFIPLVLYWRVLQSLQVVMRKMHGNVSHKLDNFKPNLANAIRMSDFMYMYKIFMVIGNLHMRLHIVWNEDIMLHLASSSKISLWQNICTCSNFTFF